MTYPLSDQDFTQRVSDELTAFLDARIATLEQIDARCGELATLVRRFVLDGGKRMRPRCAYAAYIACGSGTLEADVNKQGIVPHDNAVRAMAALELIQACALIHDDIVDDSATRRGTPTVHVKLAREHGAQHLGGDGEHYGRAQAILLGDLALAWADEMFTGALLDTPGALVDAPTGDAHAVWAAMKTEVLGGQMLDILAEARGAADLDTPQRVSRYKTAAYTMERPMHLGAVLAGADAATIAGLRECGVNAGIAFQHIDDLLGVFGDPAVTGKPSGDDLREGKRTLLLNYALAYAPAADAAELTGLLGRTLDAAHLARARAILEDSGAVAHVRSEAERLSAAADATLATLDLTSTGQNMVRMLINRAVHRTF